MEGRGEINKRVALSNILLKKDILRAWKEQGLPNVEGEAASVRSAEYFPKSIRQFNAWDLSKNSDVIRNRFSGVTRNANDTLNSYPSVRLEISGLIMSLIAMSELKKGRIDRLTDKQRRIDELRSYTSLLERELVQVRIETTDLYSRIKRYESRDSSAVNELKSVVARLEVEARRLVKENSELTAALAKITPLREA